MISISGYGHARLMCVCGVLCDICVCVCANNLAPRVSCRISTQGTRQQMHMRAFPYQSVSARLEIDRARSPLWKRPAIYVGTTEAPGRSGIVRSRQAWRTARITSVPISLRTPRAYHRTTSRQRPHVRPSPPLPGNRQLTTHHGASAPAGAPSARAPSTGCLRDHASEIAPTRSHSWDTSAIALNLPRRASPTLHARPTAPWPS